MTQTQPISVAAKRLQPVNRIITQSTGSKAALLAGAVAIGLILYADVLHLAFGVSISAYVLLAILLAATLSSVAGFAFSAICGAFLVHLINGPVKTVELMVVCSIAIQSLSVWAIRDAIDWKSLSAFLIGGALSLPIGVYLLWHVKPRAFAVLMGVFLIGYGSIMLFRKQRTLRRDFGSAGDMLSGLVGGITGGFAGFPGAFVTIWCGLKGWDKKRQRGVFQPFILVMQLLTLATIEVTRAHSHHYDMRSYIEFAYVPAALIGTWFGLGIFGRLSDRQFAIAVNLLLIASGVGLFV
jgi:uncharacterized protein